MTPNFQYEKIDKDILAVLKKAEKPMTAYSISLAVNTTHSTATTHLKELALDKIISRKKEDGNRPRTLWRLKKGGTKKIA